MVSPTRYKDHKIMRRNSWVLEINGIWYPFEHAADAIDMAITLANAESIRGRPARVLFESRKSGQREVWVSGRDRHPRDYGEQGNRSFDADMRHCQMVRARSRSGL